MTKLIELKRKNPLLFQYVKDLTVARCITADENKKPKFKKIKLYKYFKKALANYINFRLAIMKDETVKTVEKEIIMAAMRVGVNAALKEFKVSLPETDVDKIVNYIGPDIIAAVSEARVNIFTTILEYAAGSIDHED